MGKEGANSLGLPPVSLEPMVVEDFFGPVGRAQVPSTGQELKSMDTDAALKTPDSASADPAAFTLAAYRGDDPATGLGGQVGLPVTATPDVADVDLPGLAALWTHLQGRPAKTSLQSPDDGPSCTDECRLEVARVQREIADRHLEQARLEQAAEGSLAMACAEGTRTVERPLAALEAALTKLKAADAAASNERLGPELAGALSTLAAVEERIVRTERQLKVEAHVREAVERALDFARAELRAQQGTQQQGLLALMPPTASPPSPLRLGAAATPQAPFSPAPSSTLWSGAGTPSSAAESKGLDALGGEEEELSTMRRAPPPANAVALVLAAGNERPATSEFQEELDIALAPSRAALTPSRFAMTPPPRTALMSSPCLALEDASPAAQSAAGGLLLLTAAPGTEAAAANLETGALAVADDARAHRGAERARRLPARTDDAQLHLTQLCAQRDNASGLAAQQAAALEEAATDIAEQAILVRSLQGQVAELTARCKAAEAQGNAAEDSAADLARQLEDVRKAHGEAVGQLLAAWAAEDAASNKAAAAQEREAAEAEGRERREAEAQQQRAALAEAREAIHRLEADGKAAWSSARVAKRELATVQLELVAAQDDAQRANGLLAATRKYYIEYHYNRPRADLDKAKARAESAEACAADLRGQNAELARALAAARPEAEAAAPQEGAAEARSNADKEQAAQDGDLKQPLVSPPSEAEAAAPQEGCDKAPDNADDKQEGAKAAPVEGTAPPVLVSVPLHLCSSIQAVTPAVVRRGLDCVVGAFVEATSVLAAVAHFTFGLRA